MMAAPGGGAEQPVPVPRELADVPQQALEDYVQARVRQFSKAFAGQLMPGASEQAIEFAYRSSVLVGPAGLDAANSLEGLRLRFRHRCRFLACHNKDCVLCTNNPNKRCLDDDNFDECYADNQLLKSRCEADIYVELTSRKPVATSLPMVEIQVFVIDGESYMESTGRFRELLKSDEGQTLLGSYQAGSKFDSDGRLFLKIQDGAVRLPDVYITDKNDTFHKNGDTYSSFRLLARAFKRNASGQCVLLDSIPAGVSGKFIVKTQRALNDYRKSEYPHYKDELTKLKFIGSITATRLREIQNHLGDVPFTSVETVEQLRQLMAHADQNRQVENKLLDLLNMKGKHKHKWDYLRDILMEKVVYDDNLPRMWYTDDTMSQAVLFTCKQAQINLEKPLGIVQRVPAQNGVQRLVLTSNLDAQQTDMLKQWRTMAEAAWHNQHHRWVAVQENTEVLNTAGQPVTIPGLTQVAQASPALSQCDIDEPPPSMSAVSMGGRRASLASPHAMMGGSPSAGRSRRSSALGYPGQISGQDVAAAATAAAQMHGLAAQAAQRGVDMSIVNAMQAAAVAVTNTAGVLPPHAMVEHLQQGIQDQAAFEFPTRTRSMTTTAGLAQEGFEPIRGAGGSFASQSNMHPFSSGDLDGGHSGLQSAGNSTRGGDRGGGGSGHRYRRMSVPDSTGAVFQHLMSLSHSQQQQQQQQQRQLSQDIGFGDVDLSFNKRGRERASAPGQSFLDHAAAADAEEAMAHYYAQQAQQQAAAVAAAQQQQQAQQQAALSGAAQMRMRGLYHQESQGRHNPRSRRTQEQTWQAGLENSDLDAFLNMVSAGGGGGGGGDPHALHHAQQQGAGGSNMRLHPASFDRHGASQAALSGGAADHGGLSTTTALNPERLTGQMQQTLILTDTVLMGDMQDSHAGMHEMPDSPSEYPRGPRVLKHSDSDSFKRLLQGSAMFGTVQDPSAFDPIMELHVGHHTGGAGGSGGAGAGR